METNAITSGGAVTGDYGINSGANKEDFLKLLVAQLKSQDPMDPVKNEDFLAQLAQFSVVERLQNLEQTGQQSAGLQAAGLVGRTVRATASSGAEVYGAVDSVQIGANGPVLNVGGAQVTLGELEEVGR